MKILFKNSGPDNKTLPVDKIDIDIFERNKTNGKLQPLNKTDAGIKVKPDNDSVDITNVDIPTNKTIIARPTYVANGSKVIDPNKTFEIVTSTNGKLVL